MRTPDAAYAVPRLAALYDVFEDDRSDLDEAPGAFVWTRPFDVADRKSIIVNENCAVKGLARIDVLSDPALVGAVALQEFFESEEVNVHDRASEKWD